MSTLFVHQPLSLPQKNRFSRGFVLMQNEVSMRMQQNEYLFENTAICTCFGAMYYEMKGNMLQNAVRFGAKCSAFWC